MKMKQTVFPKVGL